MATASVNGNSLGLGLGETAFRTQEILSSSVQIVLPNGQPSLVDTRTGCIVSAQVIDNFTFWTTVLLLP